MLLLTGGALSGIVWGTRVVNEYGGGAEAILFAR